MPVALTLVLLVFWLVMAHRALQRGDMLLATVFLLVGIVLSVYRLRRTGKSGGPADPTKS